MSTPAIAVVVAIVALCLEYGFERPPLPLGLLIAVQFAAVGVVLGERILHVVRSPRRWEVLKGYRWGTVLVVVGTLLLLLAAEFSHLTFLRATTLSVLAAQSLLLVWVGVVAVRVNLAVSQSSLSPTRLLVLSFAGLIVAGGLLLCLPKAMAPEQRHEEGWYETQRILNCFFTSTSAVCVTGLVVYDTGSDFTYFGQGVILVLIQLGGLGIMTFGSVFGMLIRRRLSLRQSLMLQDALAQRTLGEVGRAVRFVLLATLACELTGAVMLYPLSAEHASGFAGRAFWSAFHAVSAFCNAGFALQPDSLIPHAGAWQVYCVVMPLIVLGGLGFPVLHDLFTAAVHRRRTQRALPDAPFEPPRETRAARRLSLHTRLVLITTAVLIVVPSILLFVSESCREWRSKRQLETSAVIAEAEGRVSVMPDKDTGGRIAAALFQSVTARTAGFNTVRMDVDSLSPASHFLLCVLMFIGGSPASTAGGVKTIALAVMVLGVYSTLRRRPHVECFGRTIPDEIVRMAGTVFALMLAVVVMVVLALSFTESATLQKVMFESVSACGTVGLSTGLTDQLTVPGRVIIILAMFLGRLGPLTVLVALAERQKVARYEYPREQPIVG